MYNKLLFTGPHLCKPVLYTMACEDDWPIEGFDQI